MRTTVDLDPGLLEKAKRRALGERRTLGAVLNDALAAYLGDRGRRSKAEPFELLVRGNPRGHFPSPADLASVEQEEDLAALALPGAKRRAAP